MRTPLLALSMSLGLALVAPRAADAFCGFYVSGADTKLFNQATQVALMREGTRTVLSMANNYQGPPADFAMVVPVPIVLQKENVKTLSDSIFGKLDQLTSPRLVEYWEQDPCYEPPVQKAMPEMMMTPAPMSAPAGGAPSLGVKIEAQFTVGEYQIVILSAENSLGLDTWLRQERYNIPAGAEAVLRPYVASGMKFFVAKVDITRVKKQGDRTMLSPLRFHYDSDKFELPVRLGLLNSSGVQDLIVHILAHGQRYELANYPNVTIPTNIDVREAAKGQFPAFYTALFDQTMERHPRAAVTEYSWDAGSCDPCPTPPLEPNDLATLGADALPSSKQVAGGPAPVPMMVPAPPGPSPASTFAKPPPGQGAPPPVAAPMPMPPMMPPMMMSQDFVVTRLHLRYGKDTLGEDLVFRAAGAIEGGREEPIDDKGTLRHGSQQSSVNNFQARYAVRHPWQGAIKCDHPRRGVWGGPPAGEVATSPQAATNIAFAPRQQMALGAVIAQDVPELNVKSDPNAAPPSGVGPRSGGCAGCVATGARAAGPLGSGGLAAVALALGGWVARRGRRARP